MKDKTLLIGLSSILGIQLWMPATLAQIYPLPGELEQSIFESHHDKMRRQNGAQPTPSKPRGAWHNRRFKSTSYATYAQVKKASPILMWNISRDNPGFNSLRVIGNAYPGEQVRVSKFKEKGLRRVFFMKKGINGWLKEDNLLLQ